MSYAEQFDETRKKRFRDQGKLAAGYYKSMMREHVTEIDCEGESDAPYLFYDPVKAQRASGRSQTNIDNPAKRRRRWLHYQPDIESGELVDKADVFKGMQDYKSETMRVHYGAVSNGIDETIFDGILGDAYEGKLGSKVVTLPSRQLILPTFSKSGTTGAVGMTIDKIRESRKRFAAKRYNLNQYDIMLPLSSQQIDDLGDEEKLLSVEYRQQAGPEYSSEGKLARIWNHNIIEVEGAPLIQVDVDGTLTWVQRVPAYLKQRVVLGVWEDVKEDAWPDTHKKNQLTMRVWANMDCRRMEEAAVNEIQCLVPPEYVADIEELEAA
ncbi:MAG: phage capsid protein [Pseudomonadota bacterium]